MTTWRWYRPPDDTIPTLTVPHLDNIESVHLIGVGGAGMRNLARLMLARGMAVSGSDLRESSGVEELRGLGADIRIGHDSDNLGAVDAVVVSSAIAPSNPELVEAARRAIPVWKRQQALAALAVGRRSIAVAGTHGKTTTTSMIAAILQRGGADPSFLIGGDLNESGSGARHGAGNVFVFEADESDGSFLLSSPFVGVITNIDLDHVDFYPGGLDELVRAFAEFARRCECVVAWGDDADVRRALDLADVRAVTYGGPGNDVVVDMQDLGSPGGHASVTWQAAGLQNVAIALPADGSHNLLNATAALIVGNLAGVEPRDATAALSEFTGVHRRFEQRGTARGAAFFDDYGHNPEEMAITVDTARRRRPERVVAVVQPHRYWRVKAMWRELGAAVASADVVVVTDVYGAGQEPLPGVTGKLVVDGVQLTAPGTRTVYLPHRTDVVSFLVREVRDGDLVVTMGCGDVWMLGDAAMQAMRETDGER